MSRQLRTALAIAALLLVALLLPNLTNVSQVLLLTEAMIYAAFALSLYLLLGDGGIVSFGHAAFLGAGAYTVGILTVKAELPVGLAFVCAPLVCAVLAVLIGWFSVRLTALYFAMLTMAFGQFLWAITARVDFFGGEEGIIGIPTGFLGIDPDRYYWAALAVLVFVFVVVWIVSRSPFGLALRATRDNSVRAEFSGLSVPLVRLGAFVIAGALAGVAGAMLAITNGAVSPEVGYWTQSGTVLIMVLIGGIRTIWGPVVGAFLLTYGERYIAEAVGSAWEIALGIALILLVLFMPGGVTGGISLAVEKLRGGRDRGRTPDARVGDPVAES